MILCVIETHVCICQTALDLVETDCHVHVIADAVSSRTAANKRIALDRLSRAGTVVSSTEMVLFELLKTAGHETFKELARLIKLGLRPSGLLSIVIGNIVSWFF